MSQGADLARRLSEAEATIEALLSGQVDAVVDSRSNTPVLLSKAQAALRESEERYRIIVETAAEGVIAIDKDSRITFVNGQMARLLAYAVNEMIGMNLGSIIAETAREKAAEAVARGRDGGGLERSDAVMLRKDGVDVPVRVSAIPVTDAEGKYAGAMALVTDRSQHRAAEEALRKSEEQYRQIVETTSDGIIKIDAEETITFVNPRFAQMLGYEAASLVGRSVFDLVSEAAKPLVTASLKARRQGVGGAIDTVYRHRDGTQVAVNISGSPLLDADGGYVGSLGVVRDVTEQRKLQAQLMVSDRMASVGTLAAGVAHEINNPLAAVMANLDYIADGIARMEKGDFGSGSNGKAAWLLAELKTPLDDARDAASRVRSIVRDLKIFSRSPDDEQKNAVDVKTIMESSLRMAWNEVRHRARLVKDYGRTPPVDANECRLGQVFLNLIVNAAQAIPEGSVDENEIRVATRVNGERVIIEVSDTGAGIPSESIGRIFDAFYTTKAVGVGTGLGLAICHRIVTDMGGELTVKSVPGSGTTFRVDLPVARVEVAEPAKPTRAPAVGRRGRILVIDDEPLIVRSVQRILSKEHEVVATVVAREALALCTAGEKFDLILCDLMMPEMTGMDLHRELSLVAPDQAGRMIFVTGGAFTDKARAFLTEIPKEHIEKPFDSANLRAIVQRYLR